MFRRMDDMEEDNGTGSTAAQGLTDRLNHIRSSPNLQSQKQSAVVLSAVEDTLKEQNSSFTPTAYFAALLSLLNQYVSASNGISQKEVATAVVYLLDLVTPHVPSGILRSRFSSILSSLAPALSLADADAPFLRAAIGCLVSLLVVQDSQAWALPQSQVGPRKALAGLLTLSLDRRPKVRKRATSGLATVLENGPPSPSLDHPAADMCAETALRKFEEFVQASGKDKKQHSANGAHANDSGTIHVMQLVKTVASACGGWPSKSLEPLCEVLFTVAKSKSEFLTRAAFDVFESIFAGMAKEESATKLPRLLEVVGELQPSQNDTQLLPPWLAIISRGYDVSAQLEPDHTFQSLVSLFRMISEFLASSSYNIRVSASECLISLLVNCVPLGAIRKPTEKDLEVVQHLCEIITGLLSVKYQSSWMEVFNVLCAAFDALKAQSYPHLAGVVRTVGELRGQESFSGKNQADQVLSKAILAMGSASFLSILPLNLVAPKTGEQGRAWIVPLLRDSVRNDQLGHFKSELLPLSEHLFQRILDTSSSARTMETKIFETLVQQIWDTFPGYCDVPVDLKSAFDQSFAELVCNLLYQKPEMRTILSQALQNLVESNQVIARLGEGEDPLLYGLSQEEAQANIAYLSTFSSNLLAVLFNVYTETAPQQRGTILECLDAYLSITSNEELSSTFDRVAAMLDTSLNEANAKEQPSKADSNNSTKPVMVHSLMDIVVAMATYLPRESYKSLFAIASTMINQTKDAQLQKKAYKLIPRLSQSEIGMFALQDRNAELQKLLLDNADSVLASARRDRLSALSQIIETLPPQDLHFIPTILPEIILCTKETKERSRHAAFDLLVLIGDRMESGGSIDSSKVTQDEAAAAAATNASLEEYLTMLSAGLAGNTPHMISASVTAITRVFYHFHSSLSETAVKDIVQTMDLFLSSPSREVVRAVLGFVKVCVLSLPVEFMQPRLKHLLPAVMPWSQEHKGHFKAKVKNILERMIRRFGFEAVERACPTDNLKLINYIRKQRDRKKRGKTGALPEDDEEEARGPSAKAAAAARKDPKYGNEFDEAIYGSDSDSSEDGSSDGDEDAVQFRGKGTAKSNSKAGRGRHGRDRDETYIHEDSDEPLDLLDRKALANISSTKPLRKQDRVPKRHTTKVDADGKLLLREDGDDDEDMEDVEAAHNADGLAKGINAYVDAIRGRDVAKRGQRGRLKFSNKRSKDEDDDDDDDDEQENRSVARGGGGGRGRGRGGGGGRGRGQFTGRGQIARGRGFKMQRRGGGGGAGLGRGRGGRISKPRAGGRKRL